MTKGRNPHHNRLWIARKKAGLAQKSVARLLGHHSKSPISEYETGRLLPSLLTAFKLAYIYDIALHDLYPQLHEKASEEVISTGGGLPTFERSTS